MRDLQITSKGIAARGRVHDRTSGRHSKFFLENSQMKKTLAAVAVLGAFAGTAMAADVTLYGVVDEGLKFTHVDADVDGVAKTNKFEMKSGNQAGSRFGLKGTEELGDGYKVGFILESGFNADAGTMSKANTIFNREASLSVYTPFGQVSAGKIGAITQGTSFWGKMGYFSAFGTSYGDYVAQDGQVTSTTQVWDNMIAYQTPSFAGLKVYAQYAMGSQDAENKSTSDRFYALGATYDNGPVSALLAVDSTNYKSWGETAAERVDVDDSLTVTLGGSYDFGVAKVFFGGQYFDEVKLSSVGVFKAFATDIVAADSDLDAADLEDIGDAKIKGYGLTASVSAPVLGGTSYFGAGYVDASEADSVKDVSYDVSAWLVSAGYKYDLSKRTNVYGVVTYSKAEAKAADEKIKPSAVAAMISLRHNF